MKDRNGTEVQIGCKLRSNLFGKDSTEIVYEGGVAFGYPGSSGKIYHDQESLLKSYWVVVETPSKEKDKDKKK